MTDAEKRIVRSAIRRLRGESAAADVRAALTGPARLYLETWVIPALEQTLLPPGERDLKLAESLIALPATRKEG